ncbi:hypothetical protein N9351_02370 [Candidatus Thioglobus sp.]|nr:hypothetical protein [Candidatus Thioglobus sp.]
MFDLKEKKNYVLFIGVLTFSINSIAFSFDDIKFEAPSNTEESSNNGEFSFDRLSSDFGGVFDSISNDSEGGDSDGDSVEGFSLDGLTSGLEAGLGDLTSGAGDVFREVSNAAGGGEILGLSKPVVNDFTLATKIFREALEIENSAEMEKVMASCLGEKVCSNDELEKISNASAEVIAEIERRKASGEGMSAEAKAKFQEGLVPFARGTATGGVLIAVMVNAGSQINNCDSDPFAMVACLANAAVVIDILGGLQPMVSGFMDSAGTIYDFSESNGIKVPEEESAS